VAPTLKDLMSQTSGYDDVPLIGLLRHAPYPGTLKDALGEVQPIQARKPGEMVAGSNYGAALAGYLVERATGASWEQYVEAEILRPLGTSDFSVRQPVPPELAVNLATGYRWRDGELRPQGFEYVPLAPAGGASASASAMATYMISILNYGHTATGPLMPEWAGHQMREPLYRAAGPLGAWLHGYYELRPANPRVFGHDGATLWFHSLMALFPESNTGLFVGVNSDSGAEVPALVYKAILDRYYPRSEPAIPAALPGAAQRTAAAAGWYTATQAARHTPARVMALAQSIHVVAAAANALVVSGGGISEPLRFVETEPWVYQEERGEELLVFRPSETGTPQLAFLGCTPGWGFERISWMSSPPVQLALPLLGFAVVLVALVGYPVTVLRGHLRRPKVDRRLRASQLAAWLACAAYALCLAGALSFLRDPREAVFGLPPAFIFAQGFGRLGAGLTVLAAASTAILWSRGFGQPGARIAHTLVVLGEVTLALWMARWNLLG
jgi:CubicO group peptidase (beta-lactamase class C family)